MPLRYLVVLICMFCSALASGQMNYSISGSLDGLQSGKIYLVEKQQVVQTLKNESLACDSSNVIEGEFSMAGTIAEVDEYCLFLKGTQGYKTLILANHHYSLRGSVDSIWMAKIVSDFREVEIRSNYVLGLGAIIRILN